MDDKRRILAVDDDLLFLKILNEWFVFKNYDISTTNSGEKVMDILDKNVYDAILLDVMMRHANGLDVLAEIKKNPKTKDIPVFIVSQIGEEEHKTRARELGAEEYLVKSNFSLKELTEKVDKAIERKRNSG
jgi:two-component system phosphate regulon response regulator PhoB